MFAQTLLYLKRTRPESLAEFEARIQLLQQRHPLPQPAHGIVQRIFDKALEDVTAGDAPVTATGVPQAP